MRAGTCYRHTERLIGQLSSIWAEARSFKASHDWILKERQRRVYSDPAYRKLPEHARAYIRGWERAFNNAKQSDLEWRLLYRGQWYSAHSAPTAAVPRFPETAPYGMVEAGAHFWVHDTDTSVSNTRSFQEPSRFRTYSAEACAILEPGRREVH